MDRRTLVRLFGGSGAAVVLGACSNDAEVPADTGGASGSGSTAQAHSTPSWQRWHRRPIAG